jgi:hypothetical protein
MGQLFVLSHFDVKFYFLFLQFQRVDAKCRELRNVPDCVTLICYVNVVSFTVSKQAVIGMTSR